VGHASELMHGVTRVYIVDGSRLLCALELRSEDCDDPEDHPLDLPRCPAFIRCAVRLPTPCDLLAGITVLRGGPPGDGLRAGAGLRRYGLYTQSS